MFFLFPQTNVNAFPDRATPGAGARTGHPQKWERSCWKPAEGPAAEKRDHGWNVSAEGKRSAAVSEAAVVGWQLAAGGHWSAFFWLFWWNVPALSAGRRLTKEELERRSKENMLSEVGGKALEAEEQVKVLRQRISEMEEQMKKTEEVYKEQVQLSFHALWFFLFEMNSQWNPTENVLNSFIFFF